MTENNNSWIDDINTATLPQWIKTFRSYADVAEGMHAKGEYDKTIEIGSNALEIYNAIYEFAKKNKLLNKTELAIIEGRFNSDEDISNKNFAGLKLIKNLYKSLGLAYKAKAEKCFDDKDFISSLKYASKSVIYYPQDVFTNYDLAKTLVELGAKKEGAESYETVVEIDKNYHYGRRILGDLYISEALSDYDKAKYNYEKYFEHRKQDARAYSEYGRACYTLGLHELCEWGCRKSYELKTKESYVLETFLLNILRSGKYNQAEIKKITEEFVEYYIDAYKIKKNVYSFKGRKIKKDRIKLGYISSDMNNHVVSKFLLPVIENHDRTKFDMYLFSTSKKQDNVTEKYKCCTDNFIDCSKMIYKEIADLINEKQIDILVDLSIHTGNSKIFGLAFKPAPIQAIWLGYPNTAGLDTIDYILTDKNTIYPEEADLYTEKPAYIEAGYEVFRVAKENLPSVEEAPYHKNKYITLGVFNATSKVTDSMIEVWAKILKKTKNTKIFFQYITHYTAENQKRITDEFKKHGVSKNRIIFFTKDNIETLYHCIQRADIAFDTYPYSGTGTTIDTLLAGLPIICLDGDNSTSRPTSRILKTINKRELICKDKEEYIQKAIELIKHPERIDEYRKCLQEDLLNSKLTDYEGFTRSLEKTYEQMWEAYLKEKDSK